MNAKRNAASIQQGIEIERKYLVCEQPDLAGAQSERIVQGYLAIGQDNREVRVRRSDDRCVLTVKTGAGQSRGETEIEISREQFEALWPLTDGMRLDKSRYRLPYRNHIIELDIYHGRLEGLMTAEVEFDSDRDSAAFTPPHWFDKEITEESAYKNQSLAQHGVAPIC
jgi:CYTH domain-containing protein